MHVHTVPEAEATGEVRAAYERDLASRGYIANFTQLFSLNPAAYEAWGALITSIRDRMDLRRYELATLAAASALRCRYCVSAHGAILESKFYARAELEAITRDFRNAGLEAIDVAIMAFAEKVALHAYKVTPGDVEDLRAHGLTDEEIFDVTLTAAARSFFSKTLDAMGAEPDGVLAPSTPLFDLIEQQPASAAADRV
jgi:uncharacterized peroxidase-related enzyme